MRPKIILSVIFAVMLLLAFGLTAYAAENEFITKKSMWTVMITDRVTDEAPTTFEAAIVPTKESADVAAMVDGMKHKTGAAEAFFRDVPNNDVLVAIHNNERANNELVTLQQLIEDGTAITSLTPGTFFAESIYTAEACIDTGQVFQNYAVTENPTTINEAYMVDNKTSTILMGSVEVITADGKATCIFSEGTIPRALTGRFNGANPTSAGNGLFENTMMAMVKSGYVGWTSMVETPLRV